MLKYLFFLGLIAVGMGQTIVTGLPPTGYPGQIRLAQGMPELTNQQNVIPGAGQYLLQGFPYQQVQYQPQPNYFSGIQYPLQYQQLPYVYQQNNPFGYNFPPGYPIPQQIPTLPVQEIPVRTPVVDVEVIEQPAGIVPLTPLEFAIEDLNNNGYGHAENYYYGRSEIPIELKRFSAGSSASEFRGQIMNPMQIIRSRSGIPIQPFFRRSQKTRNTNNGPPFSVNKREHYEIYKYH